MEKELNQEGDVKEQPVEKNLEEASKAPLPEEKATSEKQKAEDDWKRTMQSRADKAEFSLKSANTELQKLRTEREQQRLVARHKEIADLEGDTDGQAQAKRKHQLEDDVAKLEEQRTETEGAVDRKYDQAIDLATKHNLSLADARELMNAGSPREMELTAQLKVAEKAKVQEGSSQEEGFPTPDSGTSDAGTDSDGAFQKAWNSGELPATKENIARAQKIINK